MKVAPPAATPLVTPDIDQAMAFFDVLFPAEGWLNFRAVPEPADGRPATQHHYERGPQFRDALAGFLDYCNTMQMAAFVVPGVVTSNGTKADDVLALPAVLIDLDTGNPTESLAAAEKVLGPATIVVASGGRTPDGTPKAHAHWALASPATGADIARVCQIREGLAKQFNGDASFKQPAQPVRIPGGVHWKRGPVLSRIIASRDVRYPLDAFASFTMALSNVVPLREESSFNFDFSQDRPDTVSIERALTAPIRAAGADGVTRFEGASAVIGHCIRQVREGRYTLDEARLAAQQWNVATLMPPWPSERIDREFDALLRRDVQEKGVVTSRPTASEWARFDKWDASAFRDAPKPRPWLITGVLPLGVPGLVAARGGVGKSFLITDLAMRIATGGGQGAGLDFDFNSRLIFGGDVCAFGTAVVFTAEDDTQTIHERVVALDPERKRNNAPGRLRIIPLPDAGGARALFTGEREGYRPTAEFEEIRAWLKTLPDLKLVVFDPLQTFVAADITKSPEAGQFVCSSLGALAAELGATVLVTHHVSKTKVDITSGAALRNAIRGTTALVDGVRWVYGLWETPGNEKNPTACAAGGVVKANGKRDEREHEYQRLPSGVLRQLPPSLDPNDHVALLDGFEAAIADAATGQAPFKKTGAEGLFEQRQRLPAPFAGMTRTRIERLCQELLDAKRLVKCAVRGQTSRTWLARPESTFAAGGGEIISGAGLPA